MQVGLLRMARPTGGRGGDASCRPEPNNIQCVYIYMPAEGRPCCVGLSRVEALSSNMCTR